MKNRFVKVTLILTMLLIMAVPAQAFAATNTCSLNSSNLLSNLNSANLLKNCSLNTTNLSNNNISNILSQYSPASASQLSNLLANCSNGKVNSAQLQNLLTQLKSNCPALTTSKSTTPAAPAKTTTPAAQAKTTTPAAPAKTTTPAAPAKTTTPAAPANSSTASNYEQQVVNLVNQQRAAAGLSPLTVNATLTKVAETKAADMKNNNYFDHQSPTYGSPFDMMHQFGITYSYAGENIAMGQTTPDEVMNGWMNSPGHRANILNSNYTEIGVGYVASNNGGGYWVQEFIRP